MDDPILSREFGWTESSESDVSDVPFASDVDSDLQSSEEDEVPFARHGPLLEADLEELCMQCEFWGHCAIGFILDYRRFSVSHLQHLISVAWRIRGAVKVVGRDSSFYILHFEYLEDLNHMCSEGPWSVDGALLVLEKWRPNLVISNLQVNYIAVWVQFHGLPVEYQYPELAERMGQCMGVFEKLDWEDRLPCNIRFMRARVRIDPWLPMVTGFMLRLDDGSRVWIQCRYERIHKLCIKCGIIGHTRGQCTHNMDDIEMMLVRQRFRI
uniref:CCHC-type domain-containing protein n=1 Tax=Quercus lobata TaxID=97700 RepID=A0A7N2RCH7_QUELO